MEAKSPQKAMVAYEKALEWQDLFELAVRHSELVSEENVEAMAYRVSGSFDGSSISVDSGFTFSLPEDLVSKKRFNEAARVILDYTTDVRTAVISLVQGNEFSEALRIVRRYLTFLGFFGDIQLNTLDHSKAKARTC